MTPDQNMMSDSPIGHIEDAKANLLAPLTPEIVGKDFSIVQAQGMVTAFMVHADQAVRVKPDGVITQGECHRIRRVLSEERQEELFDAMTKGDVVEIADALADSVYVLLSVASSYGICLGPVLREVCQNNYLKTLSPKRVDALGKLLKPEGHPKPRIAEVLSILSDLVDNPVEPTAHVLVMWDGADDAISYFDVNVTMAEYEDMLTWDGYFASTNPGPEDAGRSERMFDFYEAQDEEAALKLAQGPIVGVHYDAIIYCGQL